MKRFRAWWVGRYWGALLATILLAGTLPACGPTADDIRSEIAAAGYCDVPADCVSVGAYCPFGCTIPVNDAEEERIRNLILDFYDAHPGEQCMYDCLPTNGFDCVEGSCATIDAT
ncbi:MAG: hypothetical protein ABI333_04105 [bacterium]